MFILLSALTAALEASAGPLLARDPNAKTRPAVFKATRNESEPVYPAVTFRVPGEKGDPRFRPTEAEGGGMSPISAQTVEIEAWSQSKSEAEVDSIATAIQVALDGKTLPLPNGAGRVFDIICDLRTSGLRDETNKCWFVLLRFSFKTQINVL